MLIDCTSYNSNSKFSCWRKALILLGLGGEGLRGSSIVFVVSWRRKEERADCLGGTEGADGTGRRGDGEEEVGARFRGGEGG